MSVLYLLYQLVENTSENMEMLRNVDWVVVPVVNPDGYVYTHTTVILLSIINGALLSKNFFRIAFGAKTEDQSMKIALVLI